MLTVYTRPVLDDRGAIVLYDMYVNDKWIGSRRTLDQCQQAINQYCKSMA